MCTVSPFRMTHVQQSHQSSASVDSTQPSGDLTTTGQNISNASTPGYTIETPVYAESGGQYTGSGYLPQGVSTTTVHAPVQPVSDH